MKPLAMALVAAFLASGQTTAEESIFPLKKGAELRLLLRENYTPEHHLSYKAARTALFRVVDRNDGKVELAYSSEFFPIDSAGDPIPDGNVVNTEHTWPQSKFGHVDRPGMKTDLFHLFPSRSRINADRGSKPFAEIDDHLTKKWWNSDTYSRERPTANFDAFSESNSTHFEPEEDHKGNVARALVYFFTIYEDEPTLNKAWFRPQVATMKAWHVLDKIDARELDRGKRIKGFQGNENPFVLDATLLDRAIEDLLVGQDEVVVPKSKEPTPKSTNSPSSVSSGSNPGIGAGMRSAAGPIAIISLLPNPEGPDVGNESVTLSNASDSELDLTGWKLRDKVGRTFSLSGKIPASQTLSIRLRDTEFILGNNGGSVALLDAEGDIRHSVSYTKAQARSGAFVTFGN